MIYILDTHYMLWSIADSKKLSKKAKEVITDPDNSIIVSTISFWEVSMKSSLGKLEITGFAPEDLPEACLKIGFEIVTLSAEDSSTYHKLKGVYHKDPFDPMLIWQAIQNKYTMISVDEDVKKYVSEGLKIWKEE
jgi:PIN domain nuclease of toxin-antitoxin system